jgi:predicted metalloprotease with PDZ domain
VIVRVEEGSPAQKAGLLVGDVMLAVDRTDARQRGALTAAQVGRTFVIWVRRGEEVSPFTLTTIANPRTQP